MTLAGKKDSFPGSAAAGAGVSITADSSIALMTLEMLFLNMGK
ncbi:MAG: hypothetical protein M0042_16830 [Nitrospiraceae bacterium]|nr:hypothetical protein [Nitrospiraceae bacterium]